MPQSKAVEAAATIHASFFFANGLQKVDTTNSLTPATNGRIRRFSGLHPGLALGLKMIERRFGVMQGLIS